MTQILVVGATSAMARGAAAAWAKQGQRLVLAGRDTDELSRLARDLQVRYQVRVQTARIDFDEAMDMVQWFDRLESQCGPIDGLLLAAGWMTEGEQMRRGLPGAQVIQRNYAGPVALLEVVADRLEARRQGFIAAIASVAGDRGRQSNYPYGAAKGALALYLAGLRNRLQPAGVHVMTVKPGFVDTRMTYGLPGLFLVAQPDAVGAHIVQACDRGVNTLYVPGFWRLIMLIIRSVPEWLFKRLSL